MYKKSFREEVRTQFRSSKNVEYIKAYLLDKGKKVGSGLTKSVYDYSLIADIEGKEDGYEINIGFWDEVRRINKEYISNINSITDAEEPFHIELFINNSLFPPGHEDLNGGTVTMKSDPEKVMAKKYTPTITKELKREDFLIDDTPESDSYTDRPNINLDNIPHWQNIRHDQWHRNPPLGMQLKESGNILYRNPGYEPRMYKW